MLSRPCVGIVPVKLESRQAQAPRDPWDLARVVCKSSEVTCDQLRDEKTLRTQRQAVINDVLDIPVILGNPWQEVSEFSFEWRIDCLQLAGQRVALSFRLLIGDPTPLVLLLRSDFF